MPEDKAMEKRNPTESVREFLAIYGRLMAERGYKGFDKLLMENIRLVEAAPNGATYELDITEEWTNINGVLHGGAFALIFDMATAIAMNPISKPGYWDFLAGVSRTLNISYLKAVPPGTTIRIRCEVVQHGQRLAMIRGIMESPDGKTVYATAEHHKAAIPTKPEFLERLKSMREEDKSRL